MLLIACGALAREILALKAANGWDHLDLQCLPAILHNRPRPHRPAPSRRRWRRRGPRYDRGLRRLCRLRHRRAAAGALRERSGVEMIEGPHCYSFFEGNAAFAARGEE